MMLLCHLGVVIWLSWRGARRVAGTCRPLERLLVAAVLFGALPLATLFLLWWWVSPISTGLLLLVLLGLDAWRPPPPEGAEGEGIAETGREAMLRKVSWAGLCGVLTLWLWRTVLTGTRFDYDDLTYHAANPGWWLTTGTLSPSPFTYQAYYPMNAEALALWWMLPTGTDAHTPLGVLYWGLLAALGATVLAQRIGAGWAAPWAGTLLLAGPVVRELADTFVASDLAGTAWVMAALALATYDDRRHAALLSGLAIGGAVGTRVQTAPLVGVLVLWWAWRNWRMVPWFLGASGVLSTFWFCRNLWVAGNPLFPAQLGPFAGPLDRAAQVETSLLPFISRSGADPGFWWELFWLRWDWPMALGVASLAGWAAVPLARRRDAAICILTSVFVALALFPGSPFSGTINRPDADLHGIVRYLTLPFALGGVLTVLWLRRAAWLVVVTVLLLLLALFDIAPFEMGLVVLGGTLALLVQKIPRQPEIRWVGVLLAGCGLLALATPLQEQRATENLVTWGKGARRGKPTPKRIRGPGGAFEALESLPTGRVAYFSALPQRNRFFYPFFGRSFQHRVVALTEAGMVRAPLHLRWDQEPEDWWWEWSPDAAATISPRRFLRNLRAADVDYVVVTRCPWKNRWPDQHGWLMSAGAEKVHQDPCSKVFRTSSDE